MNKIITQSLITTIICSSTIVANEKLEDITVTSALRTSQNLKDVTANTEIIGSTELEERHYTTVAQALNSLAGVDINSNGGLGHTTSLYLRGFDSKRVLVLIDGIRYNDVSSLSGAPFGDIMVSDISQIEVIKGAVSGVWGADASAGVINIITKKAKKGFSVSGSEEFGSFDTTKANANISYKNDRFYLQASHNRIRTNGFSTVAPRGTELNQWEDDGYKNSTTNLKAGVTITPTNKIDITHMIVNSFSEADAYDNATYSFNPNSIYNVQTKNRLSSINFNHIDNFNEVNLFAKKSLFKRYYPQDAFNKYFEGNTKEYGLNSKIPYNDTDFLLWGVDYKKFEDKGIGKDYNNRAIFVTNSNKFSGKMGGKTVLTESLRQDNYSAFDNKLTGKIGLKHIHENIQGLVASVNYGTAYNVPTLYNLYDPYSGNSNLNPENTKGYDITLAYKGLKATYFNNTIEDMIDYQSNYDADGNWIGGKYQNVSGKSKLKGFEIGYSRDIMDTILLSINYTNTDAKDRDGKRLARRAKDSIKFGVDYYGVEKLHLGLDGEYVGERYDRADKQGQQTGKYTVANFTANYELNPQVSIYGRVENIGDKYYQSVDGYSSSPRAVYGGMKITY